MASEGIPTHVSAGLLGAELCSELVEWPYCLLSLDESFFEEAFVWLDLCFTPDHTLLFFSLEEQTEDLILRRHLTSLQGVRIARA